MTELDIPVSNLFCLPGVGGGGVCILFLKYFFQKNIKDKKVASNFKYIFLKKEKYHKKGNAKHGD